MAHFAKVLDGVVLKVIVAEEEFFDTFVDDSPGDWIQTSFNTWGNTHLEGGTPLRGNFAGVGFIYDEENDVFYSPKKYDSWTLNTDTWLWEAPIDKPNEDGVYYIWNEEAYQSDNTTGWEARE
jgi:hypothetical protein